MRFIRRKKRSIAALVASIIFVVAALFNPTDDLKFSGTVHEIYVIDGDTVAVGSKRIRIVGIDTPELRGLCAAERNAAHNAKRAAMVLIEKATRIELYETGENDKYGRSLGDLRLDGVSFSEEMLKNGHAIRYHASGRPDWC